MKKPKVPYRLDMFTSFNMVQGASIKSVGQIIRFGVRGKFVLTFQKRFSRSTSSRQMIRPELKPTGIVGSRTSAKRANGSRLQPKMFEPSRGGSEYTDGLRKRHEYPIS